MKRTLWGLVFVVCLALVAVPTANANNGENTKAMVTIGQVGVDRASPAADQVNWMNIAATQDNSTCLTITSASSILNGSAGGAAFKQESNAVKVNANSVNIPTGNNNVLNLNLYRLGMNLATVEGYHANRCRAVIAVTFSISYSVHANGAAQIA